VEGTWGVRRALAPTIVGALGAALALASPAAALPGDLDPTFDGDGISIADFGGFEVAKDAVLEPDGDIVAAGYRGYPVSDFIAIRVTSVGAVDPGFDGDGLATAGFGADDEGEAVAIGPDGTLVVAGHTDAGGNPRNFALALFDGAGASAGTLTSDFGQSERARAVQVQGDGRIVVTGDTTANNFAVARYTTAGSLDLGFDGDGLATTTFGGSDLSFDIAVQPDGKIVAAGFTDAGPNPDDFALARYNEDGSLDTSFDGDGRIVTDFGASDRAFTVAVGPDGRIVAAGQTTGGSNPTNVALARYHADGSLDTTFGGDGKVVSDFGFNEEAGSVAIQADGKIVAGLSSTDLRVLRYRSDGALDPGFSGDGLASTNLGGTSRVLDVVIQPDGKIVGVGDTNIGGNPSNAVFVRYEGGDPPEAPGGEEPPSGGEPPHGGGAPAQTSCRGRDATLFAAAGQLTKGTADDDVIVGTPKRDRIKTSGGRDLVCSGGGNDVLLGGNGRDVLRGMNGKDRLSGGRGPDRLVGMKGNDALRGGPGRDTLSGGKGKRDRCNGGPGRDRIRKC
jgi:uncharacterized delta-60 repeat protein